jgi:hypothetical protein
MRHFQAAQLLRAPFNGGQLERQVSWEATVQLTSIQGGFNAASIAQSDSPSAGEGGGLPALDNVFNIGDTLTDNDKKLVGWDPNSKDINTAAIALAQYRHDGTVTGEVGKDFVGALKASIANGGWPQNPAALMARASQQNQLTPETSAALFGILNQSSLDTASSQAR